MNYLPSYPMEYFFLDDLYNNLYKGERVQIQLLFVFGALAIMIAFIGLVGFDCLCLEDTNERNGRAAQSAGRHTPRPHPA
jgi:hypothetical protein